MAIETDRQWPQGTGTAEAGATTRRTGARVGARVRGLFRPIAQTFFSSLAKRIVTLNLMAMVALVSGMLYMNSFREGLIDAKVQSLLTQGEIIAAAVAASATVDTGAITLDPDKLLELNTGESFSPFDDSYGLDFPINPERVAPILNRLITPTKTRARIYESTGSLILDSRYLFSRGDILRFPLPPLETRPPGLLERVKQRFMNWLWRGNLPIYTELGPDQGLDYPEVRAALQGSSASVVRMTEGGQLIVSVAVPIQRFRAVLGTLLLSAQGGDIEETLRAERLGVVRVFIVAATSTVLLSIMLASTIAGPMRRLADAANRVRRSPKARAQIPDFSYRSDEIGNLSSAISDMTNALYKRMEAIESFAADVSHELKNPLTSVRSAVETLPLVKSERDRDRLVAIIQHDVRRLDRLISDISDASRLDAELARDDADPVDLQKLLAAVVAMANDVRRDGQPEVRLKVEPASPAKKAFIVAGHDIRLSQVFTNLIDNAVSFSPQNDPVNITLSARNGTVRVVVEDRGPGIPPDNLERIFERFYTDRPGAESFGQNSGLGLSISRQIVETYRGTITAENRPFRNDAAAAAGARDGRHGDGCRFTVTLPRG